VLAAATDGLIIGCAVREGLGLNGRRHGRRHSCARRCLRVLV
jgi:hypothetical protein